MGGGGYWQWGDYKLPINHFEPSVFFHQHGMGLLKTLHSIGDKAIIDVGCFIADSVLVFRKKFPDNTIYSFEPNHNTYELAKKTLVLNRLNKVVIEPFGLGEKLETVSMHGQQIVIDGEVKGAKVDTLDNYVACHNLQVGLIKVDIEGYEQKFLAGAVNTIKEQKPILLLSIYHNYDDFYHIKPMIESWNIGYKFDFFKGIDKWCSAEILLLCEVY
jgi:FkbM family methyltransferase